MKGRCICCNAENSRYLDEEKGFQFFECTGCGLIFSPTQKKQEFGKATKKKVSQKSLRGWREWGDMRQKMFREELPNLISLKPRGRLLDVGCGVGAFLGVVRGQYDALGIDPDPGLSKTGRALGHETIQTKFLREVNGKFDIITLWDVLEHMPRVDEEMKKINALLKMDGILIIRVPNAAYAKLKMLAARVPGIKFKGGCFGAPSHRYHFTKKSLEELLKKNGFTVVQYAVSRSLIPSYLPMRMLTESLYHGGKLLYWISQGRINIVIDHMVYARKKMNERSQL